MLTVGIIQMIVNIWKYTQFLRSLRDVLSAGRGRVRIWKYVALVLLIFFLLGYLRNCRHTLRRQYLRCNNADYHLYAHEQNKGTKH